jgi:hypothetical protein
MREYRQFFGFSQTRILHTGDRLSRANRQRTAYILAAMDRLAEKRGAWKG